MTFLNGARWLRNTFTGILNWTPTVDRVINLPNDSGNLLLDDRPIGSTSYGVSLRGYEPITPVTATKTLAITDSGTVQICTNTSAATITIPLNSSVPFPIGTRIIVRKSTLLAVTLAWISGVSVLDENGVTLTLTDIANFVILRKSGTDTWICQQSIPNNVNLPGDPTVITQSASANNTRIANTAFTQQEITRTNTINSSSLIRYLFVLAGESNAGGMATNAGLTSDQISPQTQFRIWNNNTNVFQPLQIGANNLIGHTGVPDNASHGIERGLARDIRGTLNLPEAYIVKAGQGTSTIAQWAVGNASGYLATLTTRYNAALASLTASGFTVRPVFIWMQGVNDADQGNNTTTWRTATQAHFTQIRSLMGASTPILMPLIMTNTAARIAINTEIATIDSADSLLWAVPTSDIPPNPSDLFHYTQAGYLAIAERVVDVFRYQLGLRNSFLGGSNRRNLCTVIVSRTTALSSPSAAFFDVIFNNKIRDGNNAYDNTTGVFTAPYTGIYSISATIRIDNSGYIVGTMVQATGIELVRVITNFATSGGNQGNGTVLHFMNAGDTRKLNVATNAALPLTIEPTATSQINCFMTINYLGVDA